MTDPVLVAVIGGAATVVAAAITYQGRKTRNKVESVYLLVNGRMEEFKKVLHRKAKLEGYQEGVLNRHIRADDVLRTKKKGK